MEPANIDLLIDKSDSLEKLDRNEEVRNKEIINWCEYILKSRNDYRTWTNKGNLLNIRIEEKKSFFLN